MRKSAHSFSFIYRLLKLLLILLLCLVKVSQGYPNFNLEKIAKKLTGPQSLMKQAHLWNVCSQKFVRIKKPGSKGVDAMGVKGKDFTLLKITSINGGFIRIQGMDNKLYLCFNKKGQLRTRYRPPKFAPHSCDFSQNLTGDGYHTFKLRDRPDWSIGFKKKGRKLPGFLRPGRNNEICHHFSLEITDRTVITQPVDFDMYPLHHFSKDNLKEKNRFRSYRKKGKRKRKIRHNRKKNRRRGRRRRIRKPNGVDR
ncbi:fibroblast growth factor 18-like isoform X2 [Ostrea edulis]|uniref:fibroblast growth factor 18-like isoform X2 n=1 Tax=Ostrea edulis TaxID=37623 RepID=UPI0020954936|nr:fibroblast growth factor 18-like isoform X2 [Ostrea edulis]